MHIYDQQHQRADVVVCRTEAAAHFVVSTLAVHGVAATSGFAHGPFPSVEWAQGYRVTVAPDQEAAAREVLAALEGRDDVAPTDGDGTGGPPPSGDEPDAGDEPGPDDEPGGSAAG